MVYNGHWLETLPAFWFSTILTPSPLAVQNSTTSAAFALLFGQMNFSTQLKAENQDQLA